MRLFTTILSLSLSLSVPSAYAAASTSSECFVFPETTTYQPDGTTARWSVVVSGGKIVAAETSPSELTLSVGENGARHAQWNGVSCSVATTGEGSLLAPGFIEVGSRLGLVEVDLEASTRHHDAGGDPIRADHRVAESYDPLATTIPVARRGGITSAVIEPSGGGLSGQAAWVDLAGITQAETIIDQSVAFPAHLTGSSLAAGLGELRELFEDARAFARDRRAFDQNRTRLMAASRRDLEALLPVVQGEEALILRVDRAAHIEAVLRFAREEKIRLILRGGAESWRHAEALAAARVPVILDPTVYGAGSFSQREGRRDTAALLAEAGVNVLFFSTYHSSHFARNLRQLAGNAVRGGMAHADAIKALTSTPAAVFGQEEHGVIQVGAKANLVLWSGDPLEISSHVTTLMIGGELQSLSSRQTLLRDRYRSVSEQEKPAQESD
jgi:imidazolonepropionase-like amidohydrolase